MNMLEAFDLCGSFRDAGELAGCSHHTVAAYVAKRDAGELAGDGPQRRERIIDPWLGKIEEWVERSGGKIRADRAFDKLAALGFAGSERTVRRAVAEVKANHGIPPKSWRVRLGGVSPVVGVFVVDGAHHVEGAVASAGVVPAVDPGGDISVEFPRNRGGFG